MTLEQLINQKVQQIPSNLQMEVLNFVEFLETKQAINPQAEQIQLIHKNTEKIHSKNELEIDMIDYLLENPLIVDNLEFIKRVKP
jgi:two-component SAPR family response regulator